jgi:hypothetical protein
MHTLFSLYEHSKYFLNNRMVKIIISWKLLRHIPDYFRVLILPLLSLSILPLAEWSHSQSRRDVQNTTRTQKSILYTAGSFGPSADIATTPWDAMR